MTSVSWLQRILLIALVTFVSGRAGAAELFADVGLGTYYTSNAYLSRSESPDLILEPSLGLEVDLAEIWGVRYDGKLEAYIFNPDLLYHQHGLLVLANPAFGGDGENEIIAEAGVDTQRNTDTYSSVNLLRPFLSLELIMEPRHWVRWSVSERATYRWFYDEAGNDSLDSWTQASSTFTAQTRTTVGPRVAFGNRYYPHPELTDSDDRSDQQLEAGLHLSQGVWEGAGLQADYAYFHAFGDSVLVQRHVTAEEFNYIGEAFLYTGHVALLGLKQVFDMGLSFGATVTFRHKRFGGWPALNNLGEPISTGANRTDQQLEPWAWIKHTLWPKEDASRGVPAATFGLDYAYLRQWSNDYWFDTDRHLAKLTLEASW